MKIAIIGASGVLGRHVKAHLSQNHEVISVSRKHSDVEMDITNIASIQSALAAIGQCDAIISTAGALAFNHFTDMTAEEWQIGLNNKLMGQIHLAREALNYLSPNGSITLTSGIISQYPIAYGVSATTINGALEHFVSAAANELPNGIRMNVVSPNVLQESWDVYGDYFTGFNPVPAAKVVNAYERSVTGIMTGKTLTVF